MKTIASEPTVLKDVDLDYVTGGDGRDSGGTDIRTGDVRQNVSRGGQANTAGGQYADTSVHDIGGR